MKTNDKQNSVSRIAGRGLVLVGLLAVALALAASSFAQSNAAAAPKIADAKAAQPSANSRTAKTPKAPRGTGEGIQIHGWWTIEIRNRDGSVARHVEFENALIGDGPGLLVTLLSGSQVAGSWALQVFGSPSPCLAGGASEGCAMVTAGSGQAIPNTGFEDCTTLVGVANPQPYCYATLVSTPTGAVTPSLFYSSLTLSGQAYADTSSTISSVESELATCGSSPAANSGATDTVSPSACYSNSEAPLINGAVYQFTEYDFGQTGSCGGTGQPLCEIPVQAGQVISASVTFSFSSPSGDGQSATPALARPHPILRAPNPAHPAASTPVPH